MNSKSNFSNFKKALVVLAILQTSTVAMANLETSADVMLSAQKASISLNKSVSAVRAGSVIALNRSLNLNGADLAEGSELIVGSGGQLSLVNKDGQDGDDVIDTGASIKDLSSQDYTVLKMNKKTGEIEDYNLPGDFQVAGPGGGRAKHHGVTNCYHVVKALVRNRISLTGIAAYMAAPQLKSAGWHRYADYNSAPRGSVCVFAAGGIPTSSGGQRYGHVGVKGAGGIANPTSGFHLKRPFLGCWNER